jgi:cell wall-associated NlpC family hydrolase
MNLRTLSSVLIAMLCAACGGTPDRNGEAVQGDARRETGDESTCPARASATLPLPNTRAELETLPYWLSLRTDLDEPLLSPEALAAQDRAARGVDREAPRTNDLTRTLASTDLLAELRRRFRFIHDKLATGDYTTKDQKRALDTVSEASLSQFKEARSLRVALETTPLHCAPFAEALRSKSLDPRFDRNRCSSARAQEPIEVLGETSTGFLLARTRYSFGFVRPDAALSTAVAEPLDSRYRQGHELALTQPLTVSGSVLPATTLVLASEDGGAQIATPTGFERVDIDEARAFDTHRPLTRRTFLNEAFRYIGSPYGWGDENGGRDCSRLSLDVFATFGVHLPRTSALQSLSGSYALDIPSEANAVERLSLLDEADQRGIVLIHFPGHIMIYLGRDRDGVPRVLHSFAEFLVACPGGGETLYETGRVSVTGLDLGENTSRRSFLYRMTRLTVFGRAPGHALLAYTQFRASDPPAELSPRACRDSKDVAIFRSPRDPVAGQPLRIIAVSGEDLRPMSLWWVDPKQGLQTAAATDLGVGPFARVAEIQAPSAGRFTVLFGDGAQLAACEQFVVAAKADKRAQTPRASDSPVWPTRSHWERDTERFYAAFVEQLFSHDPNDLRTWSSLSELLVDPRRNLLFNYFGKNEDVAMRLAPDCADLPYFLRAYFAWKLGLPFAYRGCTRGKPGVPPRCGSILTNEEPFESANEISAFRDFARTKLASSVHSASGRTLPNDENSDLYPLPLARQALAPGSVFIDPYGHMIVVAKWLPQGLAGSGVLLGADAQPDATVGRRRFWPGNFLFTPDTREVGAGFKAFRPVVRDEEKQRLIALDDKALAAQREFPAPSLAQYEGSAEDFYTRMDELIYPRPVAVTDRLRAIVDALEEQAVRRVSAIDTGEAYLRDHSQTIAMPDGHDIFETQGPWEDFATPSRDMRLLIAIDTVRGFPQKVRAQPGRFGLESADAQQVLADLDKTLNEALAARRIHYTRTDGSAFELTLAQVVERSEAIEVGYNPNDCPESRWGAPPDSDERAPCKRSAPSAQRAKMETYRTWFHTRTRPPR